MLFELHLTTRPDVQLADWIGFCNRTKIKPLDIRLHPEGHAHGRQIMMAAVYEGDTVGALEWAVNLQDQMDASGFPIIRTKLEVPLDKSAEFQDRVRYYETHVKCAVKPDDVDHVVEYLTGYGWMASFNALYRSDHGYEKWYFTRRYYEPSYLNAAAEFHRAFGIDFQSLHFGAVRMESEAVLIDSNPNLDKGWAS